MIWLFTDDVWEPVASRVREQLETRSFEVLLLSPRAVQDLTVEIVGAELAVSLAGVQLELPEALLYLRDPVSHLAPTADVGPAQIEYVGRQWRVMMRGLIRAFEAKGIPTLNPSSAYLVDEKTAQLIAAAECGFLTPASMQTATGDDAAGFALRHDDRCAFKQFTPFAEIHSDGTALRQLLTNIAPAEELRRGLDGASVSSPTIVQPFIDAPFEHRVVVVGDQVFSARVARKGHASVDVRRVSPAKATLSVGHLPPEVAQRCVALITRYNLAFAAIDLLETAEETFVFLDLNPAGHFFWVEQLTNAPICEALADLLQSHARRRARDARARDARARPHRWGSPLPA